GQITVLLGWIAVAFAPQELEHLAEPRACVPGLDDLVDVAVLGGHVRGREHLAVLARLLGLEARRVSRLLRLAPVEDVHGALGAHDRDLGRRVGEVRVVPGKNPGTSSNVTSGMLKQSQNRTNRAPFSDALMSRHPARWAGWFGTIPTGRPPSRPKPTTMFGAKAAWTSKKYRSSSTVRTIACMS